MYAKIRIISLCFICSFLLLAVTGCGFQKEVLLEYSGYEPESFHEQEGTLRDDEVPVIDGQITETEDFNREDRDNTASAAGRIYVYICGQVQHPGVYQVDADERVFKVIQMAGGLTDEADEAGVNQAQTLADGQMIYIPAVGETAETAVAGSPAGSDEEAADSGKININTAGLEALMSLPGIGEGKARNILNYRQEHGSFRAIEDLMNVDGIKEGTFSKLKDRITI